MKNESNIDKLFREGLSNPSPQVFNEKAWQNMDALLNEKRAFSWTSAGKLASAAIFLTTLFVASNQVQVPVGEGRYAEIGINDTQRMENQLPKFFEAKVLVASNESASTSAIKSSSSRVAGFSKNGTKTSIEDNEIDRMPPTENQNLTPVIAEQSMSGSLDSELSEEMPQKVIRTATEDDVLAANLDISAMQPSPLNLTNEQAAYVGFDPVGPAQLPKIKRQSLSAFAGITLENGLGSSTNLSIYNLLYTAGLYYTVEVSKKFAIASGVAYRTKSGKGIELTRTQTEYGFGKSVQTQNLTLNRLHYIDIPLEVHYNHKGLHDIYAGASASYLLGVNSTLAETNSESLASEEQKTSSTWSYSEGISKVDLNVRVGYDYSIGQQLKIGGMVQYGLSDITSNETFEVIDNSRNMEVRVTLKYTPFRFK